jgi:hypothetical protein
VTDKAWKAAERRVAVAFGGERVGPAGFNTADVTHPLVSISVKYRKSLPRWAEVCLAEARAFKGANGKLPLLVLLGRGMRISDGLVVMRTKDWQEIYGTIDTASEDAKENTPC